METMLLFMLFVSFFMLSLLLGGYGIAMLQALSTDFSIAMLVIAVLGIIYLFNYFTVVRYLLRIIKSCEVTPFIDENVKRFKVMGYCLFVNSIWELITGYSGNFGGNFKILMTPEGSITPPMIVCFLAAHLCFVMAKVFKSAIRIKNENDLTI